MEGTTYGYARVSTREQNEARQLTPCGSLGSLGGISSRKNCQGRTLNDPSTGAWCGGWAERTCWW